MNDHDRAEQYEGAIKRFQERLTREYDGTFRLNAANGASIDIDPIVFADLKRSLEETNAMIRRGDLDPKQIENMP